MKDEEKTREQLIAELKQSRLEFIKYKENNPDAAMWQQVINKSPFSIQVVDKDGLSISVNPAHTVTFNALPEPDYNLFTDPQLLDQGLGEWFQKMQNGEAVFFPDTSYNPSKNNPKFPDFTIWLKTCAFPMLDADGKPMRYVVIHENISDRIRLEKELGEKNENLRELYDNFQSRLEMQRKRIAADLHDNLLQDLAAHNMKLAKLKKLYNNDQVSEEMQEAITHVSTMIKTARNILDSIWPTILDNQGIEAAIRVYSEQFSERFHIKVNLDIQEGLNIENEISYPLYMIFQEALTNIAKHARAGKVLISLKQKKDNIHFVISDNGKGFDENNDTEKKTFGLFMIKDLVNSLGGSYEYKKGKKNITLLDILIPINKTKKI